ncbi:MAG: alpha-2-macroglobulin family protein, partial [Myxococcaceae bacterium]
PSPSKRMMAKSPAAPSEALGLLGSGPGGGGLKDAFGGEGRMDKAEKKKPKGGKSDDGESSGEPMEGGGEGAATRAWFPETFLFEPLVVTDEQGRAIVPVRVPDRLTNWRVLALAHSRSGGQAGAVASFAGTLPTYIDAVTPPFLMAGDEVRLPIQVVNTTEAEVVQALSFEAQNAVLSAAGGMVRVPATGSQVQYLTLKVDKPGKAAVKATLGDTDAVERTFDVLPVGRPVSLSRGGTLAAPRELSLEGAAESIPGSERVRLLVFPGALAVLRAELSAAPNRGGVADDAYSLLLAGRASALIRALGEEPDPAALRTLSVIAAQRAIRYGRSPDVPTATLLAEAALTHPDNPVLSRLGERMAATVASKQRPDGSCQGGEGWTLQRLMVTTADCTRAIRASDKTPAARQRAAAATTRAEGFYERNIERVEDGYTAAAILSSGAVSGALAERLRAKVLEAITTREDGSKVLPVGQGVARADGQVPGEAEATALAVLALEKDPKAPLADLGTSLLGGYSPVYGWGDGQTNLQCMRAVLTLFKDPVPSNVKIVLEMDGKPLSSGAIDPSKLKEVISLEADAPGSAGTHRWGIRAEPPVPGLGFSLTLQAYVPWKKAEASGGLELAITGSTQGKVGEPMPVTLAATAPAGMALKIRQALPAGVQAEAASLEALVQSGAISRFTTEDGAVTIEVPARPIGQPFSAVYRVVPTLAGTLHGSASTIAPIGRLDLSYAVPPEVWTIK